VRGLLPGPSAVTAALPRAARGAGWPGSRGGGRAGRGSQSGVGGHTPPMPWARVPGDPRAAGAGPGGFPSRLARGVAQTRRRTRRATWLIGLALGLVALLALPLVVSRLSGDNSSANTAGTAPPSSQGLGSDATLASAQVQVPDLRGERISVATEKLRALDLEVDVQREGGGGGRRAVVVSMSPGPGSLVDHGSTVQLVVGRPGKDGNADGNQEGG
jgi:hypothetical protein